MFSPFSLRRLLGWLFLLNLLGACRADQQPPGDVAWYLPPPNPEDTVTTPPPAPRPAPVQEPPGPLPDTLLYPRQGFFFSLSGYNDTSGFFRQLPALPAVPGYQVYHARLGALDSIFDQPLPRRFRLPGLQVEMYHHELLQLGHDPYRRSSVWLDCNRDLVINAWEYRRQLLEFPQLRTAAGPLRQLNQQLQARYELEDPGNPELHRYDLNPDRVGAPVWEFGLSAAELARRPYYQAVDSSLEMEEERPQWETRRYRLLDTTLVYERFPYALNLTVLGAHRLLSLTDYRTDAADREDYGDAADPSGTPDYYSLRFSRRAGYDDLFQPALAADLLRAARPLLLRERQRLYPQLPITAAHWQALARPRFWGFSRQGWYAFYLADDFEESDAGYTAKHYRLVFSVLIPYARLRPYLRP